MNDLKQSRTYNNLIAAFAGETQAWARYEFFAAKAREEDYGQIAEIFQETASNEKAHAEIWYRHFAGIGTTAENLVSAAKGEHYDWSEMYADMAKTAREEGFSSIAEQMEGIAAVEKAHEERYLALENNMQQEKVFKKDEKVTWICGHCGHEHYCKDAPDVCPVCGHSRGYFRIKKENY